MMILMKFIKTSLALSSTSLNFSPFSLLILIANPVINETTNKAIKLLLDSNPLKSPTVNVLTVLSKIVNSSLAASGSTKLALIASVSDGATRLVLNVVRKPTTNATKLVTKKIQKIVIKTFPNLLPDFILAIDVVIVKKIRGTMITNIILMKISPKGLSTAVFSLKIIPTIAPIIILANKIMVCL